MVDREVVGVTGVQEPNGLGKRTELDSSVSIPDGTLGRFGLFSRYRRGTNRNGTGLQGNVGTGDNDVYTDQSVIRAPAARSSFQTFVSYSRSARALHREINTQRRTILCCAFYVKTNILLPYSY
jgi:hypothetical protein